MVYFTEPSERVVGALRVPRTAPVGIVISLFAKPFTASLKMIVRVTVAPTAIFPALDLMDTLGPLVSIVTEVAEEAVPVLPD